MLVMPAAAVAVAAAGAVAAAVAGAAGAGVPVVGVAAVAEAVDPSMGLVIADPCRAPAGSEAARN